ncbi:MAG TPA: potassium-transporting ATPase subunit KdpA [Candidatus Bathyarchaeia archaeon]|nr:potassium-transporting ATPase subunit KdpA [Candidatus Bathyarchaeia archaeon]
MFILITILIIAILSGRLLAPHITRVFTLTPSRLDKLLNPIERAIYRLIGVDPARGMGWKEYFLAALFVNIFQMVIAFAIFTLQGVLPLNPQGFPGLSWDLALMQVISFATNTNLQHYNGEGNCIQLPNCSSLFGVPGLSYFSQMMAVQFLQFTSAATGISVAVAMIRGFVARSKDLGNFYVDFTRSLTRILLPLCFVASLIFVGLGVPQTLTGYVKIASTVEGATQTILVGPVASLVSIMQLGTNGGGYYGANSAYPFQNPNPASDIFQIFLMLLIPTSLCFVFGQLIGRKRESRPILWGAYSLFALNLLIAFTPSFPLVGPGMEVRFGGFFSVFWTVVTTAVTTGSVNASLSSVNPLVILSAFNGMLIQATPGGKGVGVMYMVMFIVLTIFIVGLMSGRTPEYLGMKITSRDVKLVMIAFLVHPIIILVPTVLAYWTGAASAIGVGTNSTGFTQIFYEFTSAASNNGSDFLGASANTPFFNISTALVMFLGRFVPIGLLLALGGSMLSRKRLTTEASVKTDSILFSVVLVGSILVLVLLTFFPFLALGPILEFFQGRMNGF